MYVKIKIIKNANTYMYLFVDREKVFFNNIYKEKKRRRRNKNK